jgi:large subunit ribosomal protein L17
MRHLKSGRKFNRNNSHRKSMLYNLAISIFSHRQVITTAAKAKDVRKIVDKLITWGKSNTVHHNRLIYRVIKNRSLIRDVHDISNQYINRYGGYLQIIKLGFRKGDNAKMVVVKLINK